MDGLVHISPTFLLEESIIWEKYAIILYADGSGVKYFAWTNGVPNDADGVEHEDCLQVTPARKQRIYARRCVVRWSMILFKRGGRTIGERSLRTKICCAQ